MSCCLWHDLFQGIVERMANDLTALVSSTMSSRWLLRFGMSTSSQTETSSLSAINVSFTWKYCSSQMSLVREWNPRHFSLSQHEGRHLHPQGLVRHDRLQYQASNGSLRLPRCSPRDRGCFRPIAEAPGNPFPEMSCFFAVQVLALPNLLRILMWTKAYKNNVHLLPRELDVGFRARVCRSLYCWHRSGPSTQRMSLPLSTLRSSSPCASWAAPLSGVCAGSATGFPRLHAFGLWASMRYLVQVDR